MWPGRRLRKVGLVLVGLCGPALILAGLSPGDVRPILHYIAGGYQFPAQNIGLILLGFAAIRSKPGLGSFTLLCGIVGMTGLIFQGTPPHVSWIWWLDTRCRVPVCDLGNLNGDLLANKPSPIKGEHREALDMPSRGGEFLSSFRLILISGAKLGARGSCIATALTGFALPWVSNSRSLIHFAFFLCFIH